MTAARNAEIAAPDTPYAAYWHPICESAEVSDRPARFMLLNTPLVAFRTAEGIGVFKDLCIHRGAQLSLGWVENDRLTCPYHGFEYDVTGACTRIPSLPPTQSIPRAARAIAYHVQEAYGLVWVAMKDPVAPLPTFPNNEWEAPGTRRIIGASFRWAASAGRATENFFDVAHLPFVHDGFLGSREKPLIEPYEVEQKEDGLYFRYVVEEPGDPHTAGGEQLGNEHFVTLPYTLHIRRVTPSGEWSVYSSFACPETEKSARFFTTIVRNFNLEPEHDAEFIDLLIKALEQDKAIVEGQKPEELPVDLSEELHIKVPDAAGVVYRRMLRDLEAAAAAEKAQ